MPVENFINFNAENIMNLTRTKFFGRVGLGFVLGAFVLYGCTRDEADFSDPSDETVVEGRNAQLTRDAAQAWYEGEYQPIEPLNGPATKGGYMILVSPQWEYAEEFKHGHYEIVQVPIKSVSPGLFIDRETYDAIQREESIEVSTLARLVIHTDLKTGKTISFVMFFVGSYDYQKKQKVTKTLFKNNYFHREKDFTGQVLYFDLGKGFAGGWEYLDGKVVGQLFASENPGIGIQTKVDCVQQEVIWVQTCMWVVIWETNTWYPKGCFSNAYYREYLTKCGGGEGDSGGYPGSGGGSGSSDEGLGDPDDSAPLPVLDSPDCNEISISNRRQTYLSVRDYKNIQAQVIGGNQYVSFNTFSTKVSAQPNIEHSTSVRDYTPAYPMVLTPIIPGTATQVDNEATPTTVACIHSHSQGYSPVPSPLDLHFTVKTVAEDIATGYLATYVYNTSGVGYALRVEDRALARAFFNRYGAQFDQNTNGLVAGSELARFYNELDFRGYSDDEKAAYRLAALMNRYNTGIKLEKFSWINPDMNTTEQYDVSFEGNKIIAIKCL